MNVVLEKKSHRQPFQSSTVKRVNQPLYDLTRMKVIHSKDVVFDEESMPGIQKESV